MGTPVRATALLLLLTATASCGGSDSAGESSCNAPTDRAARKGECTLVDWDAVSATENTIELKYYVNEPGCSLDLNRVEVNETQSAVTLSVIVGFAGDEGATCPTAYGSRTTTVKLSSPLGTRTLLGCRPVGSFVPQGGYNDAAPRDLELNCAPKG
jgi:hypothetical protein